MTDRIDKSVLGRFWLNAISSGLEICSSLHCLEQNSIMWPTKIYCTVCQLMD